MLMQPDDSTKARAATYKLLNKGECDFDLSSDGAFYWLCDMKPTYRIMHYTGPIHILRRWCQELLAYNFSCIHRSPSMMVDVDYLSRMHNKLIKSHVSIATRLSLVDRATRPEAYSETILKLRESRFLGVNRIKTFLFVVRLRFNNILFTLIIELFVHS